LFNLCGGTRYNGQAMALQFFKTTLSQVKGCKGIAQLFDREEVEVYARAEKKKYFRSDFEGLITFKGLINGMEVYVALSDYQYFGGGISIESSSRFGEFIENNLKTNHPLIMILDTIGVKASQGRQTFKPVFSNIERLKRVREKNLLLSFVQGRGLGIGGLYHSIADYRLALEDSEFNLTGPKVFQFFFGEKVDFSQVSSAKRLFYKNGLNHHLVKSTEEGILFLRELFSKRNVVKLAEVNSVDQAYRELKESSLQLFPGFGKSIEVYFYPSNIKGVGVLCNPPGRPNLISVKDMELVIEALHFFKKLGLPIVSLVDAPGGDPRIEQNDLNLFPIMYQTCQSIIDYPYRKFGIVWGRCFGGASILTIPPFFGGDKGHLVEGAKMGIMDGKVLEKVFEGIPSFLNEWDVYKEKQSEDYADLIADGILEKLIAAKDILPLIRESLP
jgi:acetyl-CoA carboxylase carboxyltransferase component